MTRTGLAQDKRFQRHVTGAAHPERPERLAVIEAVLAERGQTAACAPIEVSPVELNLVRKIHDDAYLRRLERACAEGASTIDVPDSAICPESYDVARLAAGTLIRAVDLVMTGRIDNAFCTVRPPGHHAERHASMGFCLLNNVAIAAQHLITHHELSRVLILDWDVHHGNGTQHTFEADPRVLFISLHGHPGLVYPGTGYAEEKGKAEGEGYTINLPMLPPSSDRQWQKEFDDVVLPAIETFGPQFMLISAGFDAHHLDPLAPLELSTEVFGWMTDQMIQAARNHCGGRLVSTLEGGYHLDALADCVTLHVTRLLEA